MGCCAQSAQHRAGHVTNIQTYHCCYCGGYCCQLSSFAQSRLTLCNPMDCSTPGIPVHHQLLELTQTHVHRVSDAIIIVGCMKSCCESLLSTDFKKINLIIDLWDN